MISLGLIELFEPTRNGSIPRTQYRSFTNLESWFYLILIYATAILVEQICLHFFPNEQHFPPEKDRKKTLVCFDI